MNKLISAIAMTLLTTTVHAQVDVCASVHKTAGEIMQYRQQGGSMPRLINNITSRFGEDNDDAQTAIKMIEMAYDIPRFHSDEVVSRTIQDFSNDMYKTCRKNKS